MNKPDQLYRDAPVRNSPDSLDEKILRQAELHAARVNDVRRRPLLSSWMPLVASCVVAGIGFSLLLRSSILETGGDLPQVDGYPEDSVAAIDTTTAENPTTAESTAMGRSVVAEDPDRRIRALDRDLSSANELSRLDKKGDLAASASVSASPSTSTSVTPLASHSTANESPSSAVSSPVARAKSPLQLDESIRQDVAETSIEAERKSAAGTVVTRTDLPVAVTRSTRELSGPAVSALAKNATRRPAADEAADSVTDRESRQINQQLAAELTDATDAGFAVTESAHTEPLPVDSVIAETSVADPQVVESERVGSDASEQASVADDSGSRLQPVEEVVQSAGAVSGSVGNSAGVRAKTLSIADDNARTPRVERNSRNESIILVGAAAKIWLFEQPKSSYTLQLATADDDLYLAEFAGSADLPRDWQIVVLPVSDERAEPRSFTLLVGVFDSYEGALNALSQLPDHARKFTARVRNFGVLQPGSK